MSIVMPIHPGRQRRLERRWRTISMAMARLGHARTRLVDDTGLAIIVRDRLLCVIGHKGLRGRDMLRGVCGGGHRHGLVDHGGVDGLMVLVAVECRDISRRRTT